MKDRVTIYDSIRGVNLNVLVDDVTMCWIEQHIEATYINFGVRETNGESLYKEAYYYPDDLKLRILELEEYFGDLVGVFRPTDKDN